MNFSKRFGKFLFAAILLISVNNSLKAQTTLVPGDIAFTGYFGNGATALNDQFSFVLLKDITTGTVINFTDNAWFRTAATFRAGEGTVTFTSTGAIASGTEILITITSASTATATLVGGGAAAATVTGAVMPALSANGDQVLAYQGLVTSPTFISAIHMNVYSVATILPDIPGGDGVTTNTTVWDGDENTANACGLPTTLTNGVNAIWIPGSIIAEKDNAKFNCTGPLTTAAQIRAAVNNVANWITSDGDPAPTTLPTGCSYVTALPAPTFSTHPSSIGICEGTGTSFTIVAAGATSYQWQVDAGSGFGNITNNATYSGATTTTLTVTGVTNAMNGYLYRCVATNGSGSTNSNNATLTVTPLPLNPTILAKTPVTGTVADGANVSATFNAGSGGTTCTDDYRYSINGGASYLPYIPGTNISTTGVAAGSGFVFIEGRRAACASACQNSYVVLASWLVSPLPAGASTLAAGDIAFSGYIGGNNVAADEFSFVLLKNMGAGTQINFTTTGWLGAAFRTAEETVTWTVPAGGLSAGTEIKIAGLVATRSGPGAAGTVAGTALACSVNGDQILAYTGTAGAPTFISAIHMNVYRTADGDAVTTSAATWDGATDNVNASALPAGLTTGTNAIWIGNSATTGTEFDNAKFGNCSNPAVPGSITALRAALNNQANWITSDGGDPASFALPTGCNYLSVLCPTITVTNPGTTTGTTGTAFSETFTSAGGAPTVTYATASTLPTGLTLSSAGVLSGTPTQPGTFPIIVVATDANGCTGTGTSYSLVISCAVVAAPTITPGGPTTFCAGGSVTLSSSAAAGNQWYLNGNPIGGAVNQTYIATASGNYTVVETIAGPCSSGPSAGVTVTVNPAPATPTITPGGPTTFCAGGSVTLSSSSATGNQWYLNGNPIGGAVNQTYVATASGNYTVDVLGGGCTSAPSAATAVTVNPIPDATATPASQTKCTGTAITTIVMSGTVGGTTFNWTRDNTATVTGIAASGSGNIAGTLTNTTASPITVTFTITPDAAGCGGAPITATVLVNPAPPSTITGGNVTVCATGTSLSGPADPNYTYAWGRSFTAAPYTTIGSSQTQNITASGNYQLTVTNQYTCSSSSTTTVNVADFVFNGSIGAGDAQQTGRLNRFGVVSTCAAAKACPGVFTTTGARFYDSYTITNVRNTPVCATIGINSACATNVFSVAYLGSFNPASLCTNYLADPGSSFAASGFYEATIPANGTIVVVVHEVNSGAGCGSYSLTVDVPREAASVSASPGTVVCSGSPITLTASAANSYSWNPGGATTQSIIVTPSSPTTYTATLGYGNTGACTATAAETVSSNLTPTVTCPGNITLPNTINQCGSIVTYTTTPVGNPAPTETYTFTGATTASGSGNGSGSFFNVGTTTVTVTVTNSCGTGSCSFTVTINDTQAPVLTCPAPATVSCASAVPAANIASVTGVSDNCSGAVTVTHIGDVISNQTCANRFTVTRTYRATDAAGNFTECTQIITVNDITAPVLTCPAPLTVSCASAVPAANIASVTGVSDNCAGVVTVTHIGDVISSQTCANRFTITRTYRATDVCGNFAECTQIITVNDVTAPALTCPAAVTVSCASAVPAANIASVTGVSDNCGGVVTITHVGDVISSQTCANRYIITRTYRATDVCGNFTDCTQTITVNDQTAPVITCSPNLTAVTPIGSCTAIVPFTVTATDNCAGAVTIVSVPASGSAFPIGTTTVTSTATDACGNTSTCTFTVTVTDGQLPVITTQPVNRTVCTGSSATFSVVATNAVTYQWQQWNGTAWVNVPAANASSFTLNGVTTAQNTNTYRVVVTGSCTAVNSGAATLYVNPLPTINLVTSGSPVLLPTESVTITAVTSPAGGTFVWSKNGITIPGITGAALSNLRVNDAGTYRTVYTDPNGCVSTSGDIIVSAEISDLLYVYPNPNNGVFSVRFYNQPNEKVTLTVFDSKGAKVYQKTAVTNLAYTVINADISRHATGIYLVEVRNASGKLVGARRIIVGH